jgi:hypothetical protein
MTIGTRAAIWVAAACLIPLLGADAARAYAAQPGADYVLRSRFGFTLSVYPHQGRFEVQQLTSDAVGATVPPGPWQSWFGEGLVTVYSDGRWFTSTGQDLFYPGKGSPHTERLTLLGTEQGQGSDKLGPYDFVQLKWGIPGTGRSFETAFNVYQNQPYLVFVQNFPAGFPSYASGDWTQPSVSFPEFISPSWGTPQNLHSWTSGGMWTQRFAAGDAFTLQGTVEPLVVSDAGYLTTILSPFSDYLVATQQSRPFASPDGLSIGSIGAGVEGLVQSLPAGYQYKTIMAFGQGIHDTFASWGQALLTSAGKPIPSKYRDDTLKYFVYMDDAGAYYWEHGFKERGYKDYADVILGVEKDARAHGLHIGSYHVMDDLPQLDRSKGLFEPRPELFPMGLAKFHQMLGKPLELYLMWIKAGSPYSKQYPYWTADPGDLPMAMGDVFYSPEYWQYTARKLHGWGAVLLQHDFLSDYEGNVAMMSSVSKMNTYFANMASALQEEGIDMQYCMALPRNILQSTENPTVVSLQGTEDHHVPMTEPDPQPGDPDYYDPFFWKQALFGSAFYSAVGLWPSRDNIQTVADPNAFEDTLLANLLGGSMQLGHRIGEFNLDLLRKTFRDGDQLILKPDRPVTPLDQCYHSGCALGYTQSNHGSSAWYYVLSLPAAGFASEFSTADLGISGASAVYDWDTRGVTIKGPDDPIELARNAKHQYFVVAPLFGNGMAVLGDVSKFIAMADKRIAYVEVTKRSIRVGVIADSAASPIIAGYSPAVPTGVSTSEGPLPRVSSLGRLGRARSGWFWDYQTRLWWVKVDFSAAQNYVTKGFEILAGK